MKRYLIVIFTLGIVLSFLLVLYNFIDEKNVYDKVSRENQNLSKQYKKLEDSIIQYKTELIAEEDKQNDYLDTIATYEKDIEIVGSDIEKILNGVPSEVNPPKTAYLTFDDGPSKVTLKILDVLKKYGVKATFFVNGKDDAQSKEIYKRIVKEGHSIGNHTYVHSYKRVYDSEDAFFNDFNRLQALIKNVTGVSMDIMRFPGGSNNTISNHYSKGIMDKLAAHFKDTGFQYFDWNVSAGDSSSRRASVKRITRNVLKGARGKNHIIILMHDSRYKKNTATALPAIIESLQKDGFAILPLTSSSPNVQFK